MIGRTGLYLTTASTTVTGAVSGVRGGKNNTRQIRWIDTGSAEYRWRFLVNSMSSGSGSSTSVNGCRGLRIIVRREIKRLTPLAVLLVSNPASQVPANRLGKVFSLIKAVEGKINVKSSLKEQALAAGRSKPPPSQRMSNFAQSEHGWLGEGAIPMTGLHFFFRQRQAKQPSSPELLLGPGSTRRRGFDNTCGSMVGSA